MPNTRAHLPCAWGAFAPGPSWWPARPSSAPEPRRTAGQRRVAYPFVVMDRVGLGVIGARASGESAAYEGRELGATVAIIERDLFGGGCPFWQCMPSKALLHAGGVPHRGGDYPWPKASAFRDYMINRIDRDYPDDTSHFRALRKSGALPIRGEARFTRTDPLTVEVRESDGVTRSIEAEGVVLAVGSHSRIPSLPG